MKPYLQMLGVAALLITVNDLLYPFTADPAARRFFLPLVCLLNLVGVGINARIAFGEMPTKWTRVARLLSALALSVVMTFPILPLMLIIWAANRGGR